jgi:hypothetical protein
MMTADIYVKTALGLQEVSSRKMKLPNRLRLMLILVDGSRPMAKLREEGKRVGAPDDFVEQLTALDLVVPAGGIVAVTSPTVIAVPTVEASGTVTAAESPGGEYERFRAAKDFMNTTAVDAMGIKSFFFTLKLERSSTLADLAALLPDYNKGLAKSMGAEGAQVMVERVESLLR